MRNNRALQESADGGPCSCEEERRDDRHNGVCSSEMFSGNTDNNMSRALQV